MRSPPPKLYEGKGLGQLETTRVVCIGSPNPSPFLRPRASLASIHQGLSHTRAIRVIYMIHVPLSEDYKRKQYEALFHHDADQSLGSLLEGAKFHGEMTSFRDTQSSAVDAIEHGLSLQSHISYQSHP